jgi:hypothetical protein
MPLEFGGLSMPLIRLVIWALGALAPMFAPIAYAPATSATHLIFWFVWAVFWCAALFLVAIKFNRPLFGESPLTNG